MDVQQFATIFDEQMAISDGMLNSKRKEYAGKNEHTDVLHNFRMSAAIQQTNMRVALAGFLTKHIISLYDMMYEDESRAMEVWDEKITDSINYLILLKAVVIEEKGAFDEGSKLLDNMSHLPSISHITGVPEMVFTPDNDSDKDNDA